MKRLATILAAILVAGCAFHAPSLELQRRDLERQLPGVQFEREFQLRLGRVPLAIARKIVRLTDADEVRVLRNVRKLELAIYRTEALPTIDRLTIPRRARLDQRGWEMLTRVVEEDGAVWVLTREEDGAVRELMVGVLDADELVLVRLRGRIQRMLERLIEDEMLDLPGVVVADLDPAPGEPVVVAVGDY